MINIQKKNIKINIIPLIDIIFLMLVFFMLATNFSEKKEISFKLNQNIETLNDNQENLLIYIKNNSFVINEDSIENSNVEEKDIRDKFMKVFYPYTKEHKNINFLIEAELHQEKLKKMLDFNSNLFVTYDTGNITSCGLNHEDYIFELADKIKQVHIKDRIIKPLQTVEPTNGDTDFKLIFKCLKQVNYNGLYTLQTARMEDGKEIETIKRHKKIIEGIYND